MSLIKNAPVIRNPWTDDEYMQEILDEIRAASPKEPQSLTVNHDNKSVLLVFDKPLTVAEFNRLHKHQWPVEVDVQYA